MSNGIRLFIILFAGSIFAIATLSVLAAGGFTPKASAEAEGMRIENAAREAQLKSQQERTTVDKQTYQTVQQAEAAAQMEAKKQSLAQQNEFEKQQQAQQLVDMAQRSQFDRDLQAAQLEAFKQNTLLDQQARSREIARADEQARADIALKQSVTIIITVAFALGCLILTASLVFHPNGMPQWILAPVHEFRTRINPRENPTRR